MTAFEITLRSLGYETYSDYLESHHWDSFKQKYRDSGSSMVCSVCDQRKIQLHHHTYIRLGKELITDVTPLCRYHHEEVHKWLKTSGRVFVEYTHEAISYLKGKTVKIVQPKPKKKFKARKSREEYAAANRAARQKNKEIGKQLKAKSILEKAIEKKQRALAAEVKWRVSKVGPVLYRKLEDMLMKLPVEPLRIATSISNSIYMKKNPYSRMEKFVRNLELEMAKPVFTMTVEAWFPKVKKQIITPAKQLRHDCAKSWKAFLKERKIAKSG